MGAVFRSLLRTFSRHGKMKASFLLLIWLNEKVGFTKETWFKT